MSIEAKLQEVGVELPPPPEPVGAYVPAVRTGNLVYTAGQLPLREGMLLAEGKVPDAVPMLRAQACALQAALNALAAASSVAPLSAIRRVVRVTVYVNSAGGFTDQASVADGASQLFGEILSEQGGHSRVAVGVAELPLDAPVEVDVIFEVD
jgi:enamine deaminase RidA (YjgF/YER057c/UK114 family)